MSLNFISLKVMDFTNYKSTVIRTGIYFVCGI